MKRHIVSTVLSLGVIAATAAPLPADVIIDDVELPTNLSLALAEPPPVDRPTDTPNNPPAAEGDAYVGGRGMITAQGMSGMFLNPTSGTLNQGQLTLQWCFLNQDELLASDGSRTGIDVLGNGLMASYGVTDWLEVGMFSLWVIVDPSPFHPTTGDEETLNVFGPFVRVRILKDEGWQPELSVGGIFLDGDKSSDVIGRQEVFVALSKRWVLDEDGFFRSLRLHAGMRQIWKHDRPAGAAEGHNVYGGVELELPYDIYLIGEYSSREEMLGPRTPFAFGLQWKPNNVLGISIAGMQPGDARRLSFWFGVGLNFNF